MDQLELKWCDKEPGQKAEVLISPSNDTSNELYLPILTALSSNSLCGWLRMWNGINVKIVEEIYLKLFLKFNYAI